MFDYWAVSEKRSFARIATYGQQRNVRFLVCEHVKLESVIKAFENTVTPCFFETRCLPVRHQLYQC